MKLTVTALVIAFLVFACNNKSKPANDFKLPTRIFTLFLQDFTQKVSMNTSGEIFMEQKKAATISSIGNIEDMNGNLVATFSNNFLNPAGLKKESFKIDINGTIYRSGEKYLFWDQDGKLIQNSQATGISISPNNPDLYQCASIIFILYDFYSQDIKVNRPQTQQIPVERIDSIANHFKNSAAYLQAVRTKNTTYVTNALLELFDHYKVLETYKSLDEIQRAWYSDSYRALDSIGKLCRSQVLDVQALQSMSSQLENAVMLLITGGDFSDRGILQGIEDISKLIARISKQDV